MLGIHHYWVFLATGILLNLTPGQDTLYIVGRSLAHGRTVGVASALGVSTGGLVHTAAAAVGLSALLATSASAFSAIKWLGAAYVIYLGLRMIASPAKAPHSDSRPRTAAAWVAFRQGIFTNVTNPKVALFFLAFLPQFIDPAAPGKVLAFLLLGATFLITGTLWCLILALAAGSFRALLSPGSRGARLLPRITGAVFVVLGLRMAASKA